ncbi:hypothetical protein ACFV9E_06290 [Streptomyces sp. NPDC059835]|uniref:hypothetical protein n=1 Tax=Streptomyces sp. NPDC059835 TaxID=3346967 RepID=UPI003658D673
MSRSWTTRRRGDEKDLNRWLAKGKKIYIVRTPEYAGRSALWNHRRYWTEHTVTGRHPILGGWTFDNSPSTNVAGLFALADNNTIHDSPPAGIPHVSDPGPDCRDEGLYGIRRGEEIRFKGTTGDAVKQAEYLADQAEDRAKADEKSGARKRWF